MAVGPRNPNLGQDIQTLFELGVVGDLSDGELLERFLTRQGRPAEAAFTALVRRHGPMVFRVCHRILNDPDDAQDAAQATFLVLVRKAGSIRRRDSIASWLYGTALRIARRARVDMARRRVHERRVAKADRVEFDAPERSDDGWPELYRELARLPEKYQTPLILCYLEGMTTEAVARRLGCPQGTILCRLSRGRDRLRARLGRRGLTIPVGLIAAGLVSTDATAAMPAGMVASTARAAIRYAVGEAGAAAAGTVSARGLALAGWMLRTMLMTRIALLGTVLIGGIAVAVGPPSPITRPRAMAQTKVGQPQADGKKIDQPKVDEKPTPQEGGMVDIWTDSTLVLAFSPDGRTVAAGCTDSTVKLFDVAEGRPGARLEIEWPRGYPRALAFSPDGTMLVGVGDGNHVRIWDPLTGQLQLRCSFLEPVGKKLEAIEVQAVAFSPDGRQLILGGGAEGKGEIRLLDVKANRVLWSRELPGDWVAATAFAPDGETVAIVQAHIKKIRDVEVRDARTGDLIRTMRAARGGPYTLDFSRDGTKLVGGGSRRGDDGNPVGHTTIWDYRSGRVLHSLEGPSHGGRGAVFSPDGTAVAAGGYGPVIGSPYESKGVGEVILWDAQTGARLWTKYGGKADVTSLAFSPDGSLIASCDQDMLVLRDAKTGTLVRTLAKTKQVDRPVRP